MAAAAWRSAQEALINATKHSGAGQVTIVGQFGLGQLDLPISDDGQGFEPTSVTSTHLGLGIMHERAAAIGGSLTISSRPGQGTRVHLRWPAIATEQQL